MSQERVDALRSSIEAWNRGYVDAWLASTHPDIEFHPSGVFPGTDSIYRGHAGLHRFWTSFREPWESLQVRVDQVRDLGDEVVLLGTFEGHARDGMSVQREFAWILGGYVGDLALRVEAYGTWREALEAVGLLEEAISQENVDERVRPYFEAVGRRDVAAIVQWMVDAYERRDLAAAMATTLPEYEMHWRAELPDMGGAMFQGPEGVRELWRHLDENWNDFRFEPTEIIEEGEFAVVRYRQSARVPESDTRVEGYNFAVMKFRDDGRIVEVHVYADRREALEAVGLQE